MRFPSAFLDELRLRLPPSEVIGRRVNLKHKGGGEYLGLCCFHNEKTPSFTVSDDKGFYHCFGCGVHGDIVKFVMETEGLSFADAVVALAEQAGLPLPKPDPQAEARERKITTLYDVMTSACAWFEGQLASQDGRYAREYLDQRGIQEDTCKAFRLGYAPDRRAALKDHMLSKGFTLQQLIDTGLLIATTGKEPYDRFRGRIIFPIMDSKGRVIAFGGRILGDGQPKYLNSPDTELFHKGRVLYAFHLARERAYEKGNIAVVEGYMDVIAMYQAGITNVVAPLGTALTETHIQFLWKVAKEPVICLDGDAAGKRAMTKTAERALPFLQPGLSLNFALLPPGQDPDDVIKQQGAQGIRKLLTNTYPLNEVLWQMASASISPTTPERKAQLKDRLMKLAKAIKHPDVSKEYQDHFNNALWKMKLANSEKNKESYTAPEIRQAPMRFKSNKERHETVLIATVLNHPEILRDSHIEEDYHRIEPTDPQLQTLHQAIEDVILTEQLFDHESLCLVLEKRGLGNHITKIAQDKFLDTFTHVKVDGHVVKSGWAYIMSCYQLALMEEEYHQQVQILADTSSDQLWELKKQKDMLKKLVEKEKMSYEAALDD